MLVTGVVCGEPPTPVCVNLDNNAVEESSQSIITAVPADEPTQLTPLLDNYVRRIVGQQELKERFVGLQHGITSCLTFLSQSHRLLFGFCVVPLSKLGTSEFIRFFCIDTKSC